MAITNAVQSGHNVMLYDQNGNQSLSFMVPYNGGPSDGIVGFDSSSVTVRCGEYVHVYDQNGMLISTRSV